MALTEDIRFRLREAGWSETYTHDLSLYRSLYSEYGCPLPQIVETFLSKYGGLYVVHRSPLNPHQVEFFHRKRRENPDFVVPEYIEIDIDFRVCAERNIKYMQVRRSRICSDNADLAERAGVSGFWYIGMYDKLSYHLLMSEMGSIFTNADDTLLFVADDGEQAIEILLNDRELREIP